jgi:hypothetical protein
LILRRCRFFLVPLALVSLVLDILLMNIRTLPALTIRHAPPHDRVIEVTSNISFVVCLAAPDAVFLVLSSVLPALLLNWALATDYTSSRLAVSLLPLGLSEWLKE